MTIDYYNMKFSVDRWKLTRQSSNNIPIHIIPNSVCWFKVSWIELNSGWVLEVINIEIHEFRHSDVEIIGKSCNVGRKSFVYHLRGISFEVVQRDRLHAQRLFIALICSNLSLFHSLQIE